MKYTLFLFAILLTATAFADSVISTCPDPMTPAQSSFAPTLKLSKSVDPILLSAEFTEGAALLRKKVGDEKATEILETVVASVPKIGKVRALSTLEAIAHVQDLSPEKFRALWTKLGGST